MILSFSHRQHTAAHASTPKLPRPMRMWQFCPLIGIPPCMHRAGAAWPAGRCGPTGSASTATGPRRPARPWEEEAPSLPRPEGGKKGGQRSVSVWISRYVRSHGRALISKPSQPVTAKPGCHKPNQFFTAGPARPSRQAQRIDFFLNPPPQHHSTLENPFDVLACGAGVRGARIFVRRRAFCRRCAGQAEACIARPVQLSPRSRMLLSPYLQAIMQWPTLSNWKGSMLTMC
jgi:hypothetical protein